MKSQIIAHRGASKYAPENTMPAFEIANKMNADGIETDVQLTKDHIPILMHDEDLRRTTRKKGLVKDFTYHNLKQLDVGNYFSKKYKGTTIVSLDEFLKWAKDKTFHIHLELKNNKIHYQDLEILALDIVKKYELKTRTTFSTFNKKSITRLRNLDESIDIALLTSKEYNNLASLATDLGANALHLNYNLLSDKLVEQCKQNNLPYRVYTVNSRTSIKRSLQYQCNGIITDVVDKAINIRHHFHCKK